MLIKILIYPFLSIFLGFIFALIPFFCTGLQAQRMKKLGLEEKIGFAISIILFLGGFVMAYFILFIE